MQGFFCFLCSRKAPTPESGRLTSPDSLHSCSF